MSADDYFKWRKRINVSDKPSDTVVKLKDGRTFQICHRPMAGGGWVATHEDITERENCAADRQARLLELEEQNRVLHERELQLEETNRRFDIALSTMAQGLCMLDSELRVVECNDRYRQLFKLPPHVARPGAHLRDIVSLQRRRGRHPGQTVDDVMAGRIAIFQKGEPATLRTTGIDGTARSRPSTGRSRRRMGRDLRRHHRARARRG
jgi:PAS domain-containing protein